MRRSIALVLLAVAMLGACASDGGDDEPDAASTGVPVATESDADGEVEVTLGEWAVLAEPDEVEAGEVTFKVSNGGTDPHELAVIKTDLDPNKLPTKDDGSVDEEELDVVGEVEDVQPPKGDAVVSEELEVELEAGKYALICNLVEEEDGGTEVHYKLGMRTPFTVS